LTALKPAPATVLSATNPPKDQMISRLRLAAAVGVTTVAALVSASPALAITNGELDGTRHPAVGLIAVEHDGVKDAWCSGFYAGPHKADPGTGVFVTAAHCLADLAAFGFSGSDLTVTFDPELTIEVDAFAWATTAAPWHPAFAYDTAADADYGVVLLEDPLAGVAGVEFPRARDAICRAQNHPLRLDIPAARAFYGNYLELP
jgi:hypothetical protein